MNSGNPLNNPTRISREAKIRGDSRRYRSILHALPSASDLESDPAGGLVAPAGKAGTAGLQHLMARLEARMWQGGGPMGAGVLWRDPLPGVTDRRDNPSLPSGYTYLLQLIAHDLVDSVRSAAVDADGTAVSRLLNACQSPLMLDTIYGVGPDRNPHAYDLAGSDRDHPRTLLRVGTLSDRNGAPEPPEHRRYCPFRDIARTSPGTATGGRPGAGAPAATAHAEPLVADVRNDAHALISQITVLFHLLHNTVMAMVPAPAGVALPSNEAAQRRFLGARLVVTLIYRNIVENDVLPRILDARVLAAYRDNPALQLGDGTPPLEFVAGAFRFGHAMVREGYRPNHGVGLRGLRFSDALEQSARRNRGNVPVSPAWAVDWSLFFGDGDDLNLARRIGPFYSGGLMQEGARPPAMQGRPELAGRGLPSRDLLSACDSGLASVPVLCRAIRRHLGEAFQDLLPDYGVWRRPLRVWLEDAGRSLLSADDVDRLVADPPLPFFILFEAAHELDGARRPRPAAPDSTGELMFPGGGGRCLGPLGSIIVADTLYGALRSQPLGLDESGVPLKARIRRICAALLDDPGAMDQVTGRPDGEDRRLDTMSDLLALLEEQGAFGSGP